MSKVGLEAQNLIHDDGDCPSQRRDRTLCILPRQSGGQNTRRVSKLVRRDGVSTTPLVPNYGRLAATTCVLLQFFDW